jgi:geranylgeranyl pyrophosphate synthase
MFLRIKDRIEKELKKYIVSFDKAYRLSNLSPVLFNNIKEFISRDGKRIRPIMFCLGYLGYVRKPAPGLYRSALSLELQYEL